MLELCASSQIAPAFPSGSGVVKEGGGRGGYVYEHVLLTSWGLNWLDVGERFRYGPQVSVSGRLPMAWSLGYV